MNELQHGFEGKQANARAIQAIVDRHLQHALLLGEQGLDKVELRLRPFERARDNASGEHQVRLIFADPAATFHQAALPDLFQLNAQRCP